MSYHGLSMWNGSSKIHYFIDIWNSFCWRPWRPWMLLSTKFKGHKSNFRISGMYRFCFYDLYVHFWWPNKSSKHQVLSVNTLYVSNIQYPEIHRFFRFFLDFSWIFLGFFLDFSWILLGFFLDSPLNFPLNSPGILLGFKNCLRIVKWAVLSLVFLDILTINMAHTVREKIHPKMGQIDTRHPVAIPMILSFTQRANIWRFLSHFFISVIVVMSSR